jgi:hypothetical protein
MHTELVALLCVVTVDLLFEIFYYTCSVDTARLLLKLEQKKTLFFLEQKLDADNLVKCSASSSPLFQVRCRGSKGRDLPDAHPAIPTR